MYARCTFLLLTSTSHLIYVTVSFSPHSSLFLPSLLQVTTKSTGLGDDGVRADDIISSEWATVERRPVQEGGGKTDIYALALFMVIVYCVVDRE